MKKLILSAALFSVLFSGNIYPQLKYNACNNSELKVIPKYLPEKSIISFSLRKVNFRENLHRNILSGGAGYAPNFEKDYLISLNYLHRFTKSFYSGGGLSISELSYLLNAEGYFNFIPDSKSFDFMAGAGVMLTSEDKIVYVIPQINVRSDFYINDFNTLGIVLSGMLTDYRNNNQMRLSPVITGYAGIKF